MEQGSLDASAAANDGFAASFGAVVAFLQPGDSLYIPPLWLHYTVTQDDISVSFNTFFTAAAPTPMPPMPAWDFMRPAMRYVSSVSFLFYLGLLTFSLV